MIHSFMGHICMCGAGTAKIQDAQTTFSNLPYCLCRDQEKRLPLIPGGRNSHLLESGHRYPARDSQDQPLMRKSAQSRNQRSVSPSLCKKSEDIEDRLKGPDIVCTTHYARGFGRVSDFLVFCYIDEVNCWYAGAGSRNRNCRPPPKLH